MTELAPLIALATRNLEVFLLVFVRMGSMLIVTPVLGHRAVPVPHRAGLALLLALILTPLLAPGRSAAGDLPGLVLAVAGEVLIGLAIGFVAMLLMAAVEGAGELVGTQMGVSLATLFDPTSGAQSSVVARFHHHLALLLLLALNGHHLVIQAVAASFRRVRPGGLVLGGDLPVGVVGLGATVLRAGLEIAAPMVALLLVVNVGLAFLARVAPQTNVFLLGVPVSLGLGLFALAEMMPSFGRSVALLVARTGADLEALLGGALHGPR
jgi:flagellar biosynthetic protein FliR